MKLKVIIVLLAICVVSSTAQQDSVGMDIVNITATRIPKESSKTGRSVTIITAQEIERQAVTTVDELLRTVIGVNINSRGGYGVQADIGMRGSTFSQVLVLVDNVRLNDPLTGHFNHNIPVALAEIAQIEIIKGPTGASYGSDAVGGLIHIKTKAYLNYGLQSGLNVNGNLGIGQFGYRSVDAHIHHSTERLSIGVSAKINKADGEEWRNPNFDLGVADNETYTNDFDLRTYSAVLAYNVSDHFRMYVRTGYDKRSFGAKYFYTNSSFDESTEKTENLWAISALQYKAGKSDIEINLGYKDSEDFFLFNPLFPPNEHDMKQTILNYNHNYRISTRATIAYGGQYIRKDIESTDRGDHHSSAVGVYGILSMYLSDNLYLNSSLRLEDDTNFGTEWLPQLSLSYKTDDYVLRTSYGRSVRAADFTERFVSNLIPDLTPGRNIGNPDLAAEKSHSMDVGMDLFLDSRFTLSGSLFYRRSDNLIDFALTNADEIANISTLQPNEDYFYADNIANTSVGGLEVSALARVAMGQSKIKGELGYTYLKSSSPNGALSRYVSNHPKSTLTLVIDYDWGPIQLSLSNILQTRQKVDNPTISAEIKSQYFVSNLKATYSISDAIGLYIQAMNITDTQYEEILGARMPGRWISVGAHCNLGVSTSK